ncbi:cobalt ABC transporter permease [Escherichia coli]|nr:cobalt ABC transporter permease [Escherichia coli]EHW7739124.1 cobalt ABC transporter permease [Escherichia coli]EJY0872158.1 cobalt ABC transporter permease [Escherichia coli]
MMQNDNLLIPGIQDLNLEYFEWLVNSDEYETAARYLLRILSELDKNYANWGPCFSAHTPGLIATEANENICTRLAGAITTLFSHPRFNISDNGFVEMMGFHRWLALIFSVSNYRHADHIIRNINATGGGVVHPLTINNDNLKLFCLCYYPDSQIELQPDILWQYDRNTVVRLFFALLSGRVLPTPEAHHKKEVLLSWLPEKMKEVDELRFLPVSVLHDVYMHCSYADLPEKHAIKKEINRLVKKTLKYEFGEFFPVPAPEESRVKPVLVVILEWFTCQHSIYRTHSTTINALREAFEVVGIAQHDTTDDITRTVFDHFFETSANNIVLDVINYIRDIRPDVVYYPSVGMFPLTVYLTNLRLAPLQLMALGHPATTHSSLIDYVLVEEDYLGSTECFSETVIPLPVDALPYIPPANTQRIFPDRKPFTQRVKEHLPFELPVRVAVCASVMKINPEFLLTLRQISDKSQVPVRFCFYIGFAQGLTFNYLLRAIRAVLPDAEVNAHLPVQIYQQALNSCELFVNPFPFGNTNGLVDTVRQGLPGVCMTGPEVHTHIDEGLFRRLGLPETLIAQNREDYIKAALLLIENVEYREQLQKSLLDNNVDEILFRGAPEKFVEKVYSLWKEKKHMEGDK